MIRGGSNRGRIALVVACAAAALAFAVPATAGAQSAVDEYSLDIPGGGGSGSDSDSSGAPPPVDASAAGTTDTGTGTGATGESGGGNGSESSRGADSEGNKSGQRGQGERPVNLGQMHDGKTQPLDTSSRSAPEVVADTVLDSAMLPILAALALITGLGAWRVLRGRRTGRSTLSGQAG